MCGKQNFALFTVELGAVYSPAAEYPVCLVRMCGKQKFVLFTVEPGAVYSQWAFVPYFVLLFTDLLLQLRVDS